MLADVYLAMTGGQGALSLDAEAERGSDGPGAHGHVDRTGIELTVVRATSVELEGHQRQLDLIDAASPEGAVWRKPDA